MVGKAIWISLDETNDVTGRAVAHTVVGTLETIEIQSSLLHAESLEKTNSNYERYKQLGSGSICSGSGC